MWKAKFWMRLFGRLLCVLVLSFLCEHIWMHLSCLQLCVLVMSFLWKHNLGISPLLLRFNDSSFLLQPVCPDLQISRLMMTITMLDFTSIPHIFCVASALEFKINLLLRRCICTFRECWSWACIFFSSHYYGLANCIEESCILQDFDIAGHQC